LVAVIPQTREFSKRRLRAVVGQRAEIFAVCSIERANAWRSQRQGAQRYAAQRRSPTARFDRRHGDLQFPPTLSKPHLSLELSFLALRRSAHRHERSHPPTSAFSPLSKMPSKTFLASASAAPFAAYAPAHLIDEPLPSGETLIVE